MKRLFKFLLILIFAIAITGCEGIERVDNKKEAKKEKESWRSSTDCCRGKAHSNY